MARGNDALLHQSQEDTMKYPVDPGGRIAGGRRIGGVRRMHLGRLRLQTVCHGPKQEYGHVVRLWSCGL